MLAELMVINSAYKIIATSISNGKQISQVSSDVLEKYFGAEKSIAKKLANKEGNPLELFQAQDEIKKKEAELKFMLNKSRLNGYADYVKFRSAYSRQIREQEKLEKQKRYRRQKEFDENLTLAIKIMGVFVLIIGVAFGVAIYLKT